MVQLNTYLAVVVSFTLFLISIHEVSVSLPQVLILFFCSMVLTVAADILIAGLGSLYLFFIAGPGVSIRVTIAPFLYHKRFKLVDHRVHWVEVEEGYDKFGSLSVSEFIEIVRNWRPVRLNFRLPPYDKFPGGLPQGE